MFARELERHGEQPALIDQDGGTMSYAALAAAAEDSLGRLRRVAEVPAAVIVEMATTIDSVVAYVAALRGGYPALLVDAERDNQPLADIFRPAALFHAGTGTWRSGSSSAVTPHPDLAVLLSTSGSTGSPKLVRLSADAVEANARSIVEYLGIGRDERAITSLPLHYSYGLSVLHSHLAAGASIVLARHSVASDDFWTLLDETCATSIAGVPYSYDIFERRGLRDAFPATLRTLTQAGGRLDPATVAAYARATAETGRRFFAMYGQTEASARMAYLPPHLAERNPGAIGIAIPGGAFRLVGDDGLAIEDGATGELVYSGPNVMMGYAECAEELSHPAGADTLRTGDLASRDVHGLYRIEGRRSRFSKIAGLRIGLDDLERLASAHAGPAYAAGNDGLLSLAVPPGSNAEQLRDLIARECGLPLTAVAVFAGEVPRLASGKVDYPGILRLGTKAAAAETRRAEDAPMAVLLAGVLGVRTVAADDSFASLGGDSLSYVRAAMAIEQALGTLPHGWEHLTIAELELMRPAEAVRHSPLTRTGVSTEIVVRALSLMFVIVGHAAPVGTEAFRGGALVLFMLGGYSLAKFQRPGLLAGGWWLPIRSMLLRVILPYYLLMVPVLFAAKGIDRSPGWFFLVSTFTVDQRGPLFAFWFVESLFHALLITVALCAIPAVRRFALDRPVGSAFAFIGLGAAMKALVPLVWHDNQPNSLTADALFYAYCLGWALCLVKNGRQKLAVVVLAAVLSLLDWGAGSSRPYMLVAAVAAVAWVPQVTMIRAAATVLLSISASAYFIYLVHVPLTHVLRFVWQPDLPAPAMIALLLGSSILAGSIGRLVWERLVAASTGLRARQRIVD